MQRIFTQLLVTFLLFAGWQNSSLQAQMTIIDLEEFNLQQDTFLNGSDLLGGYASQDVFFPNTFLDGDFGAFWLGGWAISTMTDSVTSGFTNLYSAKPAAGFDESLTYVVGQQGAILNLEGDLAGGVVDGAYFTNGTYAHNNMRDGDAQFSKKFGGDDGTDPDTFMLSIQAFFGGELSEEKVDFFLADFRFEDSSEDYIVDTWEWVDLSSLGNVDSLLFTLTSSDTSIINGQVFLNTPAFFCMDNLTITTTSNVEQLAVSNTLKVFPNPTQHFLNIQLEGVPTAPIQIVSLEGKILHQQELQQNNIALPVQHFPKGQYFIRAFIDNRWQVQAWIKQ
ncbi:MAG: DUF4465 domain-containing protein [Bacteroidota bacterium]